MTCDVMHAMVGAIVSACVCDSMACVFYNSKAEAKKSMVCACFIIAIDPIKCVLKVTDDTVHKQIPCLPWKSYRYGGMADAVHPETLYWQKSHIDKITWIHQTACKGGTMPWPLMLEGRNPNNRAMKTWHGTNDLHCLRYI